MSVIVFYTSVSSSVQLKKDQQKVFDLLESQKIPFQRVDISQNPADKALMRKIAGSPTVLPLQICNGEVYCGDMAAFETAVEEGNLRKFLKL